MARAAKLPVIVSATLAPTVALVVSVVIVTATTGVMAVPPAAPPVAWVVTVWLLVASSVRSLAVTCASWPTVASVFAVTTCTATDAPIPTFPPAVLSTAAGAGVALTLLSSADVAATTRSAPVASTSADASTPAVVDIEMTPTASEPATVRLEPSPTPDTDCAVNFAVVGMVASTVTELPRRSVLPTCAFVVTFARFTATATPRPEPVESTAWPSAVADDFAFDPAWIFWVPVVSTLAVPPPLPAT